jgi:DNA repair protein RecO (recombination protein O)
MKTFKTQGFVIKRKNFGEADRIITIFSKTHGKLKIKANGVRRIISRRSPHIELLNFCSFNLYQGKHLPILTEVDSLENFSSLKNDLEKVGFAYHVCELVDGLCAENQENLEAYNLLGRTLRLINTEKNPLEIVKDFEIKLLTALGFYTHRQSLQLSTHDFIENILERRLKSKQILLDPSVF